MRLFGIFCERRFVLWVGGRELVGHCEAGEIAGMGFVSVRIWVGLFLDAELGLNCRIAVLVVV